MTPKSLEEFPKDARDAVYKILAKHAERKAKAAEQKGA